MILIYRHSGSLGSMHVFCAGNSIISSIDMNQSNEVGLSVKPFVIFRDFDRDS
jgi:hypothetical protein